MTTKSRYAESASSSGRSSRRYEGYGDVDRAVVVAGTARSEHEARTTVVAYVVAGEFGCSEEALSEYLQELLPEYMLPSAYVFLDEMPLTTNGKVDRAALPRAQTGRVGAYRPPRTELERTVAELWAEMLGQESASIGVTDDFFRLGGDSIIALQVLGRLRQGLGVDLPVNELLNRPTIEGICAFLDGQLAQHRSRSPTFPVTRRCFPYRSGSFAATSPARTTGTSRF